MEALRAEISIAELCRKYSINESQFYKCNKEFLEAGKKRLSGDTTREAASDEIAELRKENQRLKKTVINNHRNEYQKFKLLTKYSLRKTTI